MHVHTNDIVISQSNSFGDDGTGPADESKRTKRVQGWSRQIMGGDFYYLQYFYSVK